MPVAYLMRLTDAHHTLARVAKAAGLEAPPLPASEGSAGIFNPFFSTQSAAGVALPVKRRTPDGKSAAERVRDEEVRRRERELQQKADTCPPLPLQPTAFWLNAGRKIEDVVRDTMETMAQAV